MGGLGHYLEAAGLPTTQISLIREHTQTIKPPRALWVPFDLGRPFGAPGDDEFQTGVLRRVLRLLTASAGPVLEDYDKDAPETAEGEGLIACPVSFEPADVEAVKAQALRDSFLAELQRLRPWYDEGVKSRGRTAFGVSGLELDDLGPFIAGFAVGNFSDNPRRELPLSATLRLAAEDLKAFYFTAALAESGKKAPGSTRINDWFWQQTAAGQVLKQVKEKCIESDDARLRAVGSFLLVPMSQAHRH